MIIVSVDTGSVPAELRNIVLCLSSFPLIMAMAVGAGAGEGGPWPIPPIASKGRALGSGRGRCLPGCIQAR